MIGVHVECDRCGRYTVWSGVPVSKAKRQARRAGWRFGKTGTLCPGCEPFKRAGLAGGSKNSTVERAGEA